MTTRFILIAVLAVLLAASLAACGSLGGSTATTSPAPAGSPGSASPSPAASPLAGGVRELPAEVGSPTLGGTLTLPAGDGPFPAVVLVSGSGPNDRDETIGPNKPFRDLARGLARRGIATLRYDKRSRAYPGSADPRTFTVQDEYVPDALAAIAVLEREPAVDPRRIFLLGHSQGGTLAPLIAAKAPQLAGVILYAASTESLGAAMLRQLRYLATLPGDTGAQARAQLPEAEQLTALLDSRAALARQDPGRALMGGVGPAYFLSALDYDEVAAARALPQPLLLVQGGRDYQVTVADDLRAWQQGLMGRDGVTVEVLPADDHIFFRGSGRPTPAGYTRPGHVDPAAIAAVARWVRAVSTRP